MTVVLIERPLTDTDFFASTVPRAFVHRAAVSEVLVTGWREDGPDAYEVGAQWPRAHSYYGPEDGVHDPLLLAETVRQAGLLLAHVAFGVPLDFQFVMHDLSFSFLTASGLDVDLMPTDVVLRFTWTEIGRRRSFPVGLRYRVRVLRGGVEVAEATASFRCLSPEAYRRMRGPRVEAPLGLPAPAVPPALVSRTREEDVVLAPAAEVGVWRLRVNREHPVLFDHDVDHVPGMLLFEAVRQVTHLVVQPLRVLPLAIAMEFHRYVELTSADGSELSTSVRAWLTDQAAPTLQVTVEVVQGGEVAARARVGALSVR